jgi:hypothetical protein
MKGKTACTDNFIEEGSVGVLISSLSSCTTPEHYVTRTLCHVGLKREREGVSRGIKSKNHTTQVSPLPSQENYTLFY